uniref:hypothetical protein n=1 Tax=Alloprevotella sp. TaxID=1872471 RepID=UPI004027EC04
KGNQAWHVSSALPPLSRGFLLKLCGRKLMPWDTNARLLKPPARLWACNGVTQQGCLLVAVAPIGTNV